MKNWKTITIGVLVSFLSLAFAGKAMASEGIIELSNSAQPAVRCYGLSVFDKANQFNVLVTCRNLIYPPATYDLHYVLWASPVGQGNQILLGDIAPGKLYAKTKIQFDNVYITREKSSKPKTPSNQILVSGKVAPIAFLGETVSPSPVVEAEQEIQENQVETSEKENIELEEALADENQEESKNLLPFSNTTFIIIGGLIGLIFLLYVVLKKS